MLLLTFVIVIFGILMAVDTVCWDLYFVLYDWLVCACSSYHSINYKIKLSI